LPAILKKTEHLIGSGEHIERTAADYEELRSYAIGGHEAHETAISDLAVLITYGTGAWLRPRNERYSYQTKWEKPEYGNIGGNLAILLANIVESRGEHEFGKH